MKRKINVRNACYYSYLSMSSVFCVPSMLFMTFHEMYGISYTLLGTLVLINFLTQLSIDLVFTFFSKHFNIRHTVILMPLLTFTGISVYALIPTFFPKIAFWGFAIGTVFFSISAGLSEVLVSPIIAALPSDNPQRDMSRLHSLYAWGVVMNVMISTLFITVFGAENWMYLMLFLAVLPLGASLLYYLAELPKLDMDGASASAGYAKERNLRIALCFLCIFFGSGTENAMTNWISSYAENALGISKSVCDILGIALFALALGTVRSMYAKYGKNIKKTILIGMIFSLVCYVCCAVSTNKALCLISAIATGAFSSMLWPGTLIMMEEICDGVAVSAYALMAAGGDFGGGASPQLLGLVCDRVSETTFAAELALKYGMSVEQIGLRAGMLVTTIFPILGIAVILIIMKRTKTK